MAKEKLVTSSFLTLLGTSFASLSSIDDASAAGVAGLTESGKIYYSEDAVTWTQIPGRLKEVAVANLDDKEPEDLVGINDDGKIYYSTNLQSWNQIPGELSTFVVGDFNGDGVDDLAGLNADGEIFYSTDLQSWARIPGILSAISVGDFNADNMDDLAGINPSNKVYYSTNLGTWINVSGGLVSLMADDLAGEENQDEIVGIGTNGAIYYYDISKAQWSKIPGSLKIMMTGDLDGDGVADVAGLDDSGNILYSTDLMNWVQIPGLPSKELILSDFNGDNKYELLSLDKNGQTVFYTLDQKPFGHVFAERRSSAIDKESLECLYEQNGLLSGSELCPDCYFDYSGSIIEGISDTACSNYLDQVCTVDDYGILVGGPSECSEYFDNPDPYGGGGNCYYDYDSGELLLSVYGGDGGDCPTMCLFEEGELSYGSSECLSYSDQVCEFGDYGSIVSGPNECLYYYTPYGGGGYG